MKFQILQDLLSEPELANVFNPLYLRALLKESADRAIAQARHPFVESYLGRLGVPDRLPREDALAFASHQNAAKGTADGRLTAEIVPVSVPPKYEAAMTSDNGQAAKGPKPQGQARDNSEGKDSPSNAAHNKVDSQRTKKHPIGSNATRRQSSLVFVRLVLRRPMLCV